MKLSLPLLGFGFAFFPFVSLIPMGTDIQPTFFLTALFCIGAWGLNYKLGKIDLFFLILIMTTLFYQSSIGSPVLTGFLRFTFSYIAFVFFRQFMHKITDKLIFVLSAIHFGALAINYAAPVQFGSIAELVIRTFKVTSIGVRGASGFSPEPGFAGAIAVCLMAAAFALKDVRGHSRYFLQTVVLCIVSVALTRSGTGSLLLIGFLGLYYLKITPKNILIFMILSFVGFSGLMNLDLGRGTDAIRLIMQNPIEAFLSDRSMGARVLSALVSVYAIIENPLGSGIGSFDSVGLAIAQKYNLYQFAAGAESGKIASLSMLSLYCVELGLPWVLFLATIFVWGFREYGFSAVPYLFLSFYFIFTSFSLAFPPTWFFLAFTIISRELSKTERPSLAD